ncbi:CIA30 family protein [Rhodopseudomonas palustris]|uniref:CIA30 family protein n=1 Tax=Rhodopseudomonas palustris TaxID=1076 RepID=UPI002ACD5510|nr:CIA30 family protein [Rhodopseudomonas palustris]WQG97706.1 CIA30 family protein [Rhodopseudomonas palustris]
MQIELWPAGGERRWRLVTDAVMGGVSQGTLQATEVGGRPAARMRGAVSTENNGGFIQIAMDLAPDGGAYDAGGFTGVSIEVSGNGERYGVHLRTTDMVRPQQSYREGFAAPPRWTVVHLPFVQFVPHRIETPLNITRLRRIGLVAIGRAFDADLSVARLWLY